MKYITLIEDELLFAVDLRMQLQALYPGVHVQHFMTAKAAMLALENTLPDLVLLDVMLEEELASMAVAQKALGKKIPVIFMTAFEREDLFRLAVDLKPANYLQKPFTPTGLKYAIGLALSNKVRTLPPLKVTESTEHVMLKDKEGVIERIVVEDITHIRAFGNYCNVHTFYKKYTQRMTIKNYRDVIKSGNFIRIFRNCVVNVSHVAAVDTQVGEVVLVGGERLPYSINYKKELLQTFRVM